MKLKLYGGLVSAWKCIYQGSGNIPSPACSFVKKRLLCGWGHLYEWTIVYALEYQILELTGDSFIRHFDADTGLFIGK